MEWRERSLLDVLRECVVLSEDEFVGSQKYPVLVTPFNLSSSDSLRNLSGGGDKGSFSDNMYDAYRQVVIYNVGPFGTHPFKGTLYVLGTADSCDVRLLFGGVGESHAILRKGSSAWLIKGSVGNEVFVTEKTGFERKIESNEEFELFDAALVRFGDAQLEFYSVGGLYTHLKNLEAMARNPNFGG